MNKGVLQNFLYSGCRKEVRAIFDAAESTLKNYPNFSEIAYLSGFKNIKQGG